MAEINCIYLLQGNNIHSMVVGGSNERPMFLIS